MTEVTACHVVAKHGLEGRVGIEDDAVREGLAQRQKFVPTQNTLAPIDRP